MGKLEKEHRVRKTKINAAIMGTVAAAGALAVIAVAPGVVSALGVARYLPQRRYEVRTTLSNLIKKGYLTVDRSEGTARVRLTEKGERFVALIEAGERKPQKQRRWDGKWRVLVFDIPERRKSVRIRLRIMLVSLGFAYLQDSVWVYPYPCDDLITMIKAELRIGNGLRYLIADVIENDAALRSHFSLPKTC